MAKDKGWEYLHNSDDDTNASADGGWEYRNSDGSSSFYGVDGSWGYKNSDGNGSYYGADGSWGYKNSDGSSSYHGASGSWGYKNSDGSGSYYGADGSWESRNSDGSGSSYAVEEPPMSSSSGSSFGEKMFDSLVDIGTDFTSKLINYSVSDNYNKTCSKKRMRAKDVWKIVGFSLAGVAGLVLLCFLGFGIFQISKLTPIEYDSASLKSKNYETVVTQFVELGFNNISTRGLHDLAPGNEELLGIVELVTIDGDDSFKENDKFPYDAEVVIYYHSPLMLQTCLSASDCEGMHYDEVVAHFQSIGFVNIRTEKQADLIFGWITPNGATAKVSINGSSDFNSDALFSPDAEVVIVYHTYIVS